MRFFLYQLLLLGGIFLTAALQSQLYGIDEAHFQEQYQESVEPFLRAVETPFYWQGYDHLNLSGVFYRHPHPKGVILFVEGFAESWIRYRELFYDLYQAGYTIYSYDHRGQGFSPHLSKVSPKICHITFFAEYSNDLNCFIHDQILPHKSPKTPLFLIGHSLGGSIITYYLEKGSQGAFREVNKKIAKVVLVAPFFRINSNLISPFEESLIRILAELKVLQGKGEQENFIYAKYNQDSIFKNESLFSSSDIRWREISQLITEYPETYIEAPSNQWVFEVLGNLPLISQSTASIKIPLSLIEGGSDAFTDNQTAEASFYQMPNVSSVMIPQGHHQLFEESDEIRNQVLETIKNFLIDKT